MATKTKWLHFRVADDLHEWVKREASADRRNMGNFINLVLEDAKRRKEQHNGRSAERDE